MQKARANKVLEQKPVGSISEARAMLKSPGESALVVRGRPRNLAMKCPCGCGELLIINLDPAAGRAWRLYKRKKGLSLYPSIWRETGCESHFVISENNIWWCDWEDEYYGSGVDAEFQDAVFRHLSDEPTSFELIAVRMDEVPWLVLIACRDLVHGGRAVEGEGKNRACFSRKAR